MSLQVWLPLTKDLRNQGLCNIGTINSNAVYSATDGKLGGCYKFTNQTISMTPTTELKNSFNGAASIACWVKISTSHSAYAQCVTYGTVSTSWTAIFFGIDINGSGVPIGNVANGTNNTNCSFVTAIKDNQWHHLCLTYVAGTMKSYLDGILKTTTSTSYTPAWTNATIFTIGGNSSEVFKNGDAMNDIRLYNHCLSSMEVKELAKGLVLHYPLNRGGWGQNNILLNTGFESRYTQSTGWDTTKNGTQLASSWGGYNGGVTNPSTVYHAHLKQVNGEWVYEYIRTANESWLGISQGGLQSKLTAGKTYTFSWEEYRVEGNNYPTGGLYYYKTGATSANFHLGQFGGSSGNILGEWRKFSYTFTAPTDGDYSKNMSWYIYGHSGGNGKMYMRHPKLEEGSIATPWCPNSSDALATTMGLNSTTEYDCSGFCNNGTRTGTFTWTSDTPRYQVSTKFTGTQFITADSPTSEGATLALRVKTTSTSNAAIAIDYKSKLGFGFYSGVIIPSCNGNIKTTYATTNYTINQWNHIVVVRNSSSALQLYINGVLQTNTTSAQDYWSGGVIDGLSIAARPNGSSPVSCQVSDVHIYATALSADDVKSLYQNSAYIDSSGNVYGAVHTEV